MEMCVRARIYVNGDAVSRASLIPRCAVFAAPVIAATGTCYITLDVIIVADSDSHFGRNSC